MQWQWGMTFSRLKRITVDKDAQVERREEAVAFLHCHRATGREAGYLLVDEEAADTPPARSPSAVLDSQSASDTVQPAVSFLMQDNPGC